MGTYVVHYTLDRLRSMSITVTAEDREDAWNVAAKELHDTYVHPFEITTIYECYDWDVIR